MKLSIYYKKLPFVRSIILKSALNALLTICFTLIVVHSNAQSCISWQTVLGKPNLDERATDIWFDKTTDTFWVCGYQTNLNSQGLANKNGWLMQFNRAGELIEDFVIEDTTNLFINALAKTDSGFVLAGCRQALDNPGEKRAWLAFFKGDSVEWVINQTVQSELKDVLVMPNQKIVVTGYIEQNEERRKELLIEEYDSGGNLSWQQTYGGTKDDEANAIIYNQNQLFIAGSTASSDGDVSLPIGAKDVWLLAIEPNNGTLIKQKNFGGTSNEVAMGLTVLPNNEMAVLAESLSTNGDISNSIGNGDFWLAKIDEQWNIVWEKSYGGLNADFPKAITSFPEGDLLIAGSSFSENVDITINYGYIDSWLARINYTDGSIIWSKVIGGDDEDKISALCIYDEQKIFTAGHTDSFNIQCKKESKKHINQNVWLLGLDEILLNNNNAPYELAPLISYTIQKPYIHVQNNSLDAVDILITDITGKIYYNAPFRENHTQNIYFSAWENGLHLLSYKKNTRIHFVAKLGLF